MKSILANEHIQAILDASPFACMFWDADFIPRDCNQAALNLFGVSSKQEYLALFTTLSPAFQANGRASGEVAREHLKTALETGRHYFFWKYRTKSGEPLPSHVALTRLETATSALIIAYIQDLRESEATKSARHMADKRVRIMLDLAPLCCSFWNENLIITDCNEEAARQFDLSSKQDYVNHFYELSPEFQPDGRPSKETALEYLKAAFETGYQRFYWMHQKLNGEPVPSEITLVRARHSQGQILVAYGRDLREAEAIENARRMADRRVRAMLDHAPFCCAFWDEQFTLTDCNQEAVRQFDLADKQDYLDHFYEFSPEFQPDGRPSKETALEYLKAALETGYQRFYWMHQKLNGEPVPSEVTLVRARHSHGLILAAYTRDLREAAAAEAERRKADERIRIMLDASPLACNFWDENYANIESNAAAARLFDFRDKSEYLGNFFKLSPEFQPDGRPSKESALENIRAAFETGYQRFEWLHRKLDGELIPAEITLVRVQYGEKHIVLGYTRDLREHKAMLAEIGAYEKELQQALILAEENGRAKTEFLTNISHELRTPMNAILGMSRLLAKTELSGKQRGFLKNAVGSAELLLRLIDDILDFSAIVDGKLVLERTPFALADITRELDDMMRGEVAAKKLELHTELAPDVPPQCIGDPLRLKQVLLHLVGNAVKFTRHGRILVEINVQSKTGDSVVLHCLVQDSGVGMSAEQMEKLFTIFSQADGSHSRKHGGSGLGLALCKSLIAQMQGNIWCESKPGEGSSFHLTVPFALPGNGGDTGQPDETARDARFSGARILLAEDNAINQIITTELLESKGMFVDVASNGLEALELLSKTEYDLVLMDIQMPEMDGITATAQIRAQEKYRDMPILALTSHARERDRELSLASKMNAHLTKPIDPETLYAALYVWLPDKSRA